MVCRTDSSPVASKITPETGIKLRSILPCLRKCYNFHIFDILVSLASGVSTAVFSAAVRRFSFFRYIPKPRFEKRPTDDPAEEYPPPLQAGTLEGWGRWGVLLLADSMV